MAPIAMLRDSFHPSPRRGGVCDSGGVCFIYSNMYVYSLFLHILRRCHSLQTRLTLLFCCSAHRARKSVVAAAAAAPAALVAAKPSQSRYRGDAMTAHRKYHSMLERSPPYSWSLSSSMASTVSRPASMASMILTQLHPQWSTDFSSGRRNLLSAAVEAPAPAPKSEKASS